MRILLIAAYDGTNYHGWQVQPGIPTIEGKLNSALSELTGENIEVIGASRTDAGVHSMGTVAVFDTVSHIPADKYVKALNGMLPWDIRIMDSYQVADDFHPRHCDSKKTYCYHLFHGDICPPNERLYNFHVYGPLDVAAMNRAAQAFVGEHDFAGFCAVGSQAETTVRTIYEIGVTVREKENNPLTDPETAYGEHIDIRVTGSGFLYNMVRIIAGTLLAVGRSQITEGDMVDIISSCDRAKAGPTLPAMGLMLEKYEFCKDNSMSEELGTSDQAGTYHYSEKDNDPE